MAAVARHVLSLVESLVEGSSDNVVELRQRWTCLCDRGDVRFAGKATPSLRGNEMTRWANGDIGKRERMARSIPLDDCPTCRTPSRLRRGGMSPGSPNGHQQKYTTHDQYSPEYRIL